MTTHGEIARFFLVGATTVAIDLGIYRATMFVGLPTGAAKAVGFLTGTIFAYFVNRLWTFNAAGRAGDPKEVARFLMVYFGSLVANVAVNDGVLAFFGLSEPVLAAAFLAATACSATLNFVGMKFLVFRSALS